MKREGLFAILYAVSAVLSVVTVAASVAAWIHWSEILDNCSDSYCGCILYGTNSQVIFSGGPIHLCHFVSFSSLPVFAIALVLGCYYGYRACFYKQPTRKPTSRRNRNVAVVTSAAEERLSRSKELGFKRWLCLTLAAVACASLLTATAVVLTAGYLGTCGQYRQRLVQNLGDAAHVSAVVYDRLGCGAVLDFMDLMEPTTRPFFEKEGEENRHPLAEQNDRYRGDLIDTGAALQTAVACAWLDAILWAAVFVLDVKLYGRYKCCC